MRISDWSSDVCSSDLLLRLCEHAGGGFAIMADRARFTPPAMDPVVERDDDDIDVIEPLTRDDEGLCQPPGLDRGVGVQHRHGCGTGGGSSDTGASSRPSREWRGP